ncbi:carbamate kinase [Sporomusaceae bacterium BoRhaA]|uniref:carbamate kinase n=1 Tax=Pelorhabdus rhamnosifermentans TaxID=2772457 RepID=UPI001C0627CF|nr:carbamate kinase [Pelorhabdus rhamnosifermentans]MBU2702478.1 carbamate kinase [Pelorhabdus rhamnosifermentans]
MDKQLVIALGGNALGNTPDEQKQAVLAAASHIASLVKNGYKIVIVHGNGPQVGMINLAFELAYKQNSKVSAMPFAECCAMSQGYIGFHLQNALQNAFFTQGITTHVSTAITQVIVNPHDPAFQRPTKPVGLFYTEASAREIRKERGYTFVEDSGRGFRRVVPSPEPVDIKEKGTIRCLMENGDVVIACGGGGIPVYRENGMLYSVDAVIDKDKAAAKLAEVIHADIFIILTAVPSVAINFGKKNQKWLGRITIDEAQRYIEEGHFAPGSMLPKVEAAIRFVKSGPGREAIITSLENAYKAVTEESGTIICS